MAEGLQEVGLPTRITADFAVDEIVDKMQVDKKKTDTGLRFILLEGLGKAVISDHVPLTLVEETVNQAFIRG